MDVVEGSHKVRNVDVWVSAREEFCWRLLVEPGDAAYIRMAGRTDDSMTRADRWFRGSNH